MNKKLFFPLFYTFLFKKIFNYVSVAENIYFSKTICQKISYLCLLTNKIFNTWIIKITAFSFHTKKKIKDILFIQ